MADSSTRSVLLLYLFQKLPSHCAHDRAWNTWKCHGNPNRNIEKWKIFVIKMAVKIYGNFYFSWAPPPFTTSNLEKKKKIFFSNIKQYTDHQCAKFRLFLSVALFSIDFHAIFRIFSAKIQWHRHYYDRELEFLLLTDNCSGYNSRLWL